MRPECLTPNLPKPRITPITCECGYPRLLARLHPFRRSSNKRALLVRLKSGVAFWCYFTMYTVSSLKSGVTLQRTLLVEQRLALLLLRRLVAGLESAVGL